MARKNVTPKYYWKVLSKNTNFLSNKFIFEVLDGSFQASFQGYLQDFNVILEMRDSNRCLYLQARKGSYGVRGVVSGGLIWYACITILLAIIKYTSLLVGYLRDSKLQSLLPEIKRSAAIATKGFISFTLLQ